MSGLAKVDGASVSVGDELYYITDRTFVPVVDTAIGIRVRTKAGNVVSLTSTGATRGSPSNPGVQLLFWDDITVLKPRPHDPVYELLPAMRQLFRQKLTLLSLPKVNVTPIVPTEPPAPIIDGVEVKEGDRLYHIGNREFMVVTELSDKLTLRTSAGTSVKLRLDGYNSDLSGKAKHKMVFWRDITLIRPTKEDPVYGMLPTLYAFLYEELRVQ